MKILYTSLVALLVSAADLAAQTADPLGTLQGGENVATAFVLSGPLPINASGNTSGYLDDYDEACPYPGSTAPDVVYSYSPGSDVTVDIDLCGSSFDTKLYVYENAVTPGIPYDCNDDFYIDAGCGLYVSKIESIFLSAGNTYYIVIDGYDEFAFGGYVLSITDNTPPPACTWGVDFICPPGALTENETCGANTNGGCTMAPGFENRETIPAPGATFCGTLWANGGSRDNDQFELVLTEVSQVILTADATQLVQFGLMTGGNGGYNGSPDCLTISGVSPANTAGPCNETTLDLGLLSPGTYWFSVAMTVFNGFPCDNHYWINFDVIPQPCPPPVDLAVSNITASAATLSWTESGTASSWEYQVGASGFTPAANGTATNLNPKAVSGLSASTAYDFYVRSSCSPAFSEWEGPFAFTTLCGSVASVPWTEGFESAWPPACWADTEAADYGWSLSTYGTAHNGSQWAYCNLAGSKLSSLQFTLTAHSSLSFWFRVEDADFPQDLTVKAGNDVIYQASGATNEDYQQVGISLAAYTGQVISVSFTAGTGYGASASGICLDDVSVTSFNIWTGNSGTAWNDIANWSKGTVPVQSEALLIPSAPSGNNFPIISGGITGQCDFISVEPGATISIQAGSTLEVKNP